MIINPKIKYISLLLIFLLTILFSTNIIKADELEPVYYPNIILENKLYNLETGVIEDNNSYISIQRFTVNESNLKVDNMFYHHILMWDSQNRYLGYFNNALFTSVKDGKYMGDLDNPYNINLLPKTRIVAFVGAKEVVINFQMPSIIGGYVDPLTTFNDIYNISVIDDNNRIINSTSILIGDNLVYNKMQYNPTFTRLWFFPDNTAPQITLQDDNYVTGFEIYSNLPITITFNRIGYNNNISFMTLESVRPYKEVSPTPPPSSILEKINNYLDKLGINTTFAKITISIVIIIAILLLLGILGVNSIIIIIVGLILYILFTLLGWLQLWILLVIMMLVFVILIFGSTRKGAVVDD